LVLGFRVANWLRYGVPLGILFLCEYGVIARSYPMGVFFLLLAIRFYHKKNLTGFWALLCLFSATHLLFTLSAGVILLLSFWDHRKDLGSKDRLMPAIVAACTIAGIFYFQLPPSDSAFVQRPSLLGMSFERLVSTFAFGASGIGTPYTSFAEGGNPWTWASGLLVVTVFAAMAWDGFAIARYLAVIVLPLVVIGGPFVPLMRHAGVFYVMAIGIALLYPKQPLKVPRPLAILVLMAASSTVRWIAIWEPYKSPPTCDLSGSAELVAAVGPLLQSKDSLLIVDYDAIFFPPMAVLGISIYDVRRERMLDYPLFKVSEFKTDFRTWCQKNGSNLEALFPGKTLLFGTIAMERPPEECGPYEQVFQTHRYVRNDETYGIFKRAREARK
jgi:hypothetical protein